MASFGPDHKLAQALDLARREAGLTTADLAKALSFSPRTVRRYLNGERRPERDTIVRWEQVCKTTPGTLVALYDCAPANDALPPPRTPSRLRVAIATIVFVALCAALLLRGREEPNREAAPQRPTSVASHRFSASHVGDVWIRIVPAREHLGESHRVTLRWGKLLQHADVKNLDRGHTLFTAKTSPDRIPIWVNVKPAATITFGERNVPAGAQDINQGWKKTQ